MTVVVQIFHKIGLPHPPLVDWNDLYKDHIGFIYYYFDLLPLSYNVSEYKDQRARKLYTSARIYEWKFGKGEWELPFASPTGRVRGVPAYTQSTQLRTLIFECPKNKNVLNRE